MRAFPLPRSWPWLLLFSLCAVAAFFTYEPAVSVLGVGMLYAALVPPTAGEGLALGERLRRAATVILLSLPAVAVILGSKLYTSRKGYPAIFLPHDWAGMKFRIYLFVRGCVAIFTLLHGSDSRIYRILSLGLTPAGGSARLPGTARGLGPGPGSRRCPGDLAHPLPGRALRSISGSQPTCSPSPPPPTSSRATSISARCRPRCCWLGGSWSRRGPLRGLARPARGVRHPGHAGGGRRSDPRRLGAHRPGRRLGRRPCSRNDGPPASLGGLAPGGRPRAPSAGPRSHQAPQGGVGQRARRPGAGRHRRLRLHQRAARGP